MKLLKWYAKSVTIDELETTINEIQGAIDLRECQIKYILEKTNGQFVIVWCEIKSMQLNQSPKFLEATQ